MIRSSKLVNNSFDKMINGDYHTNIKVLHKTDLLTNLVVDACAMIFPPIGFLGSAVNMAAPSTWATT